MSVWAAFEYRRASCHGKRTYDIAEARFVAKWQRRRTDVAVQAYRCPFCRRYHVGATGMSHEK